MIIFLISCFMFNKDKYVFQIQLYEPVVSSLPQGDFETIVTESL